MQAGHDNFSQIEPNNSPELSAPQSQDPTGEPSPSREYISGQELVSSKGPLGPSSGSLEDAVVSGLACAGDTSKKRPVSIRKIRANRDNAKRSTGPTSLAGKRRVRWNSLKHGLSSKSLFSRPIDGEEMAEYFRFLKALHRDLRPEGMLEEMHVEGAAVAYWLIQRSLRSENGEIRRSQLKQKSPKGGAFFLSVISQELAEIDDHLGIPERQALDQILRHRTAAHKDLSYHLAELERLQRARKGDHIPPPINIQVR